MENVADALRMAFGVLVFVIAISITVSLVSQANATTNQIFNNMDKITYLEQAVGSTEAANHRIVGMETIIPTIYRYSVENVGVTIVRKVSGKYQLVARYDLETDKVAAHITNMKMFESKPENKKIHTYIQSAMSYYRHINYLIDTLKVDNELIFESSTKTQFFAENDELLEEYDTNKDLQDRINALYEYRLEKGSSAKSYYGTTPWTDNIAQRLERDLSGEGKVELNGKYYGFQKYDTDKDNLLEYMQDKQFKEYIIEVSTGEITEEDILQGNDSGKLEIIYVEQPEN